MVQSVISVEGVSFSYRPNAKEPTFALKDINLEVQAGEYLVIVGHNGSGKSTLAKHFNALLAPSKGQVKVNDLDTRDSSNTLSVRKTVGMVFQVPDNQIVATVVEEDVAFGPLNFGLMATEVNERVMEALAMMDLSGFEKKTSHHLSLGERKRVALATVLSMKPEVLAFDDHSPTWPHPWYCS